MRLGGPVFIETQDPVEVAKAHRNLGYRAAYCPSDITIKEDDRIAAVKQAFENEDVVIAEVGAWCNPLDPREEFAKKNIAYVAERLALADELGALCCVNIIGTRSTENWYGPHLESYSQDFFDQAVEVGRKIIDSVKPKISKMTFEIMPYSFLDGPEEYLRFIKALNRNEAGVHFDPANCICSPRIYYNNGQLITRAFELLGDHIVSCHAKDILIKPEPFSVQFDEVRPGLGLMDYKAFLRGVNSLPGDIPVMLEHQPSDDEYTLAREYIVSKSNSLGLHF